MRVLLIEDEVQLQQSIVLQLQLDNFTVDVTGNGREGLFSRSRSGKAASE